MGFVRLQSCWHQALIITVPHPCDDFPAPMLGYANILLLMLDDANTPVVLSSFTALLSPDNNVRLTWITQSETGMLGYRIIRSATNELENSLYLNELIEATNTSQQQVYVFTDTDLQAAGTYYYWLESVELDGTSEYYGPVSMTVDPAGGNPTPEIQLITGLNAVYPNPFNPTAFIPYSLAGTADVTIRIYNVRGQLVRIFSPGNKLPGNYTLIWDGTDSSGSGCPSGIYYIMLSAGKESFQRKAILLK
jgi:hypothetical protein